MLFWKYFTAQSCVIMSCVIMPRRRPVGKGHYKLYRGVRLSVCLSRAST